MTTPDRTPFVFMIGMDVPPESTSEDVAAFDDGYAQIHTPEVVESHPGIVRGTRYELVERDPRTGSVPRWICLYEISSEAAATAFIARVDGGADGYPVYRNWTSIDWSLCWRLLWKRQSSTEGTIGKWRRPYLLLHGLEGGDVDLGEHAITGPSAAGETVARDQVHDFERVRAFDHPAPGCPRFLRAIDGGQELQHLASPSTDLPPDTAWRAVYRRLSSYGRLALVEPTTSVMRRTPFDTDA